MLICMACFVGEQVVIDIFAGPDDDVVIEDGDAIDEEDALFSFFL